jgi:hypothetical protein
MAESSLAKAENPAERKLQAPDECGALAIHLSGFDSIPANEAALNGNQTQPLLLLEEAPI